MDTMFSSDKFLSDMTFYDQCDCAVFMNCTNTTITIVTPPSGTPVPVPTECSYSCQDIMNMNSSILNLTIIINDLQDEIDMLIGQYQSIASRITVIETW